MKSDKAMAKESAPTVRKNGTVTKAAAKAPAKAAKAPAKSVANPAAKAAVKKVAAKKPAVAKAPAPAAEAVAKPARKRAAPKPAAEHVAAVPAGGSPLLEASLSATAAMLAAPLQAGVGEAVQVMAAVALMEESERRARIAVEAYLIAESRGFPPGREDAHWLEAEEKLFGAR